MNRVGYGQGYSISQCGNIVFMTKCLGQTRYLSVRKFDSSQNSMYQILHSVTRSLMTLHSKIINTISEVIELFIQPSHIQLWRVEDISEKYQSAIRSTTLYLPYLWKYWKKSVGWILFNLLENRSIVFWSSHSTIYISVGRDSFFWNFSHEI
jgi:hypothetical protein